MACWKKIKIKINNAIASIYDIVITIILTNNLGFLFLFLIVIILAVKNQ